MSGILSSFNIGVSGIAAHGGHMSIIGDNIANANTNGFKSSRAQFQDVLATSLKGIDGGDQFGSGVKLAHITPTFSQGNIARTESITDLALNGNGFFTVDAPFGRGFSRDGAFHFDKDGNMINSDGYKVLGYAATESGDISNKLGPIRLGSVAIPATATKEVKINMNLNSMDDVKQFNIEDPENTSSYNNSITVYDNVGTARLVTVYFNKVGNNQWEYHAAVDGKDAEGGEEGKMVEMASGTITFSPKGVLQEEAEGNNSFNFNNGAAPDQQIKFNFGESLVEGGDGLDGSTQYGTKSTISRHTQDGSSAAQLASLSFNDNGILTAVYDNGESRDVGQIGVAKFENNEGLFKVGKNLYKESRKSGQAAMGKPNEGGRGEVIAKSIELSNVDLATEFVNLMTAQRNFQASAKTITTSDQMLKEVLNLKR
jgi:flagellar hook protein FlgE